MQELILNIGKDRFYFKCKKVACFSMLLRNLSVLLPLAYENVLELAEMGSISSKKRKKC